MSLISPIRNRYLSAPCGCGSCRCETPFIVHESKSEGKMSSTTQREVIEVGIEELIRRSDAILPAIAERAQQTARDRRRPEATIQDIRAAGLTRFMQPVRWGGHGLAFDAYSE